MVKGKVRNIGIEAKAPEATCNDPKCPWHGRLSVRGKVLDGIVASTRAQKTAVIEREYLHFIPKYERYEKRRGRISAYKPECISAKVGDKVRIAECRPVSKTKSFVVVENLSKK
jgi:small subunit ribosomal protein S17